MNRASTLNDLFFGKRGSHFELAVEANIPKEESKAGKNGKYKICRYEVSIGNSEDKGEWHILDEILWLMSGTQDTPERQQGLFPRVPDAPDTIMLSLPGRGSGRKKIFSKAKSGDHFWSETTKWNYPLRLGARRSRLANVPEDTDKFPVSNWLRSVLIEGVQRLALDVKSMRKPCSPVAPSFFLPDGSNLPLVLRRLRENHPDKFQKWLAHVQTVLSDVIDIEVVEQQEDRYLHLAVKYSNNIRVSSWRLSDGTLRFLALTLLPYLSGVDRVYLVEEPENGIHPTAIDAVFQSLSSVYEGQVLVATHSPLVLARADLKNILCFAKTKDGATDIVSGSDHPALLGWKGKETLDVLYAAGVLG